MTNYLMIPAMLFGGCVPAASDSQQGSTQSDTKTSLAACEDPGYGDGECDMNLSCEAPDIDCFRFFEGHDDAVAFFEAFEMQLAQEQFRDPRSVVDAADPRVAQLQGLLDEGWESYQQAYPVADLADRAPWLLLIEDPEANAFVLPDVENDVSAFLVVGQTGLLDIGVTDDELLALMLHELRHAVALHLIRGERERVRTFYLAADVEPIGRDQLDDPTVRSYGDAWIERAADAGPWTDPELGGIPLLGGGFYQLFITHVLDSLEANPTACQPPAGEVSIAIAEYARRIDPVHNTLRLDPTEGLLLNAEAAMEALKTECMVGPDQDFLAVAAAQIGITPDDLRSALGPEQLALVEGEHFLDGLTGIVAAIRGEMRDLEAEMEVETGAPWSSLRYFSVEEDADDATVPVMAGLGRQPDAIGSFFGALLGPYIEPLCMDVIASGEQPGYGDDLTDDHHATCWRIAHATQLARGLPTEPLALRGDQRPGLPLPASPLAWPESVRKKRLADRILY